jgi:hypothetical protein
LGWLAKGAALFLTQQHLIGRSTAQVFDTHESPDVIKAKIAAMQASALASVATQHIVTHGRDALATWEKLRQAGTGWPVVIGGDEDLNRVLDSLIAPATGTTDILAAAARIRFPEDFRSHLAAENRQAAASIQTMLHNGVPLPHFVDVSPDGTARELSAAEARQRFAQSVGPREPKLGAWPDHPPANPGLAVAQDLQGQPLEKVHILVLPTHDGADVPAILRWGNWNACPAPEFHVAALRSWHQRYGVELVGLSSDVMNLRATRRPATRSEAIALAREQYLYCEDIVDQGTETLAPLAATLMADDWWFFWWD